MKRPIRVSFFFDLCPSRRPWTQRHHVMTISVIITNCHKKTHHLMPDSWYTFGHRQEMKSAHLGQRACPCWVTCLPHVGNVRAQNRTKSIMEWHARKRDSNHAIRTDTFRFMRTRFSKGYVRLLGYCLYGVLPYYIIQQCNSRQIAKRNRIFILPICQFCNFP